jgi:hypothetical protein
LPSVRIAFIGLERCLAPEVGHFTDHDLFRRSPKFRSELGESAYRKWLAIDDYLSEILGQAVAPGEEHRYKPSIALADILFTAPDFDAINYPSVAPKITASILRFTLRAPTSYFDRLRHG